MNPSDQQKLTTSNTTSSLPMPRFLQPGPVMFPYPSGQPMNTYISFPQPQPYFTGVGTVPVTITSTQQYISSAPMSNSSFSLAAPRLFPMYQTSQNLTSYPTYATASGSVILPSTTSYTVSTSVKPESHQPKRTVGNLSVERALCVSTLDENAEPDSPGRSSRPTSLSPRDARVESMNSSVFPFQENKPLMTSPTRRNRNLKVKGELVGLRVAEIESDIIKRSMMIPKKQNSVLSSSSAN